MHSSEINLDVVKEEPKDGVYSANANTQECDDEASINLFEPLLS